MQATAPASTVTSPFCLLIAAMIFPITGYEYIPVSSGAGDKKN